MPLSMRPFQSGARGAAVRAGLMLLATVTPCVVSACRSTPAEQHLAQTRAALSLVPDAGDIPAGGDPIDVAMYATGAGTVASPWVGWDTRLAWTAATSYRFRSGVYAYAATPAWGQHDIKLLGDRDVVLEYTGASGDAVLFDGTPFGNGLRGVVFENFTVTNTNLQTGEAWGSGVNGVRMVLAAGCTMRNIRIAGVGGTGLLLQGALISTFDTIRVGGDEPPLLPQPAVGIELAYTADQGGVGCNVDTFISPIVEGVQTTGILLDPGAAFGNVFTGGSSRNNEYGVLINNASDGWTFYNTFVGIDLENNSLYDAEVRGSWNTFENARSNTFHLADVAARNVLHGGSYGQVTVDQTATDNVLQLTGGAQASLVGGPGSVKSFKDTTNQTQVPNVTTPLAGDADFVRGFWSFNQAQATFISGTGVSSAGPWRALFIGTFYDDTGPSLPQSAVLTEVTSTSNSIVIGSPDGGSSTTLTFSLDGVLMGQVSPSSPSTNVYFVGSVLVVPANLTEYAGTRSAAFSGSVTLGSVSFASLPASAADGTLLYCPDCATLSSPCSPTDGGATGAIAKRLGGAWTCD